MATLPISDFVNTNLYFSAFLLISSALLLLGKYLFRWNSDLTSVLCWLMMSAGSACLAWFITSNASSAAIGLTIFLAVIFFYRKLIPVISVFGLFFLASMAAPSLYGLVWLFQTARLISDTLQVSWPLFLLINLGTLIFALLVLINTIMLCCMGTVRFSDLYFRFPRRDNAWKIFSRTKGEFPFVSLHVPCYAEPPEMVIKTLDALASQTYLNFEVIVLDNNTKDPKLWKPLQEHCKKLGKHFSFYHIDHLEGAKAGALNRAMQLTSAKAELIAVIDADYIAQPDFLIKLVGYFDDPKTGFVQTCHDYRDWKESPYLSACYYEYAMHFKLDLPGQSEWDTAYTVGTMCLIRKKALEQAGGWAEWCLTEDSEVAVRLHALGYAGYYLKDTFGRGLIPLTFDDYKLQRFRWTAGPIQQLQKHWRLYLPWNGTNCLTFKQKMSEAFHSLSISLSECLFLFITLPITFTLIWLTIVKGFTFVIPTSLWVFVLALMGRNVIFNWIRNQLIHGNWQSYFASSIASRSLLYTRTRAFYKAWFYKNLAWKRTDKFKKEYNLFRILSSSSSEMALGLLYLTGLALLAPYANYSHPDLICLIMLGMLNQAISYFCAPLMAFLSENELSKNEKAGEVNQANLIANLEVEIPEKETKPPSTVIGK